ncbi:phosphoribosylanthranilate isomerase [Glutamicibacter sp. NPDC087344]|uniref:phosphoribosylanthranilate isomerase n=1 Tax=Glutamicibacter sp. NPDC087344 TaxID=3363994 RepID=UPI00380C56F8
MSQPPFVKVCGLSTANDVAVALEHGADALGFVLTPSPREVSPELAAELISAVPDTVATVAVFRSEDVATAIELSRQATVGWIQLHGHRTPEDIAAAKHAGFHTIRAVRMDAPASEFEDWGEDFLLIDAAVPGSGESWDYAAVRELAAGRRWLVAGGLDAGNVARAVAESQATGADVSSGVESSRGVKDPQLIAAFLDAAKIGSRTPNENIPGI